jgi:hypothetical protein
MSRQGKQTLALLPRSALGGMQRLLDRPQRKHGCTTCLSLKRGCGRQRFLHPESRSSISGPFSCIDSAGIGAIATHYVHCQRHLAQFLLTAANLWVMELLKVIKVHTFVPLAASLDDAQGFY